MVNTSTDTNVSDNSIQVFIETGDGYLPLEGVAIQLDNNGACIKTDKKGFVRFDNVSSDKHDIHVFGNPGYEWRSSYQVDYSLGKVLYYLIDKINNQPEPNTTNYSYVNINGNIFNSSIDNNISLSYRSKIYYSHYSGNG